jgi:hypothetical protein
MDSSYITNFSLDEINSSSSTSSTSVSSGGGMSPVAYAVAWRMLKKQEEKQEQARVEAWVVDLVKYGADLNNFGTQPRLIHPESYLSLAEAVGEICSLEGCQQLAETVSEQKYIDHLLFGMNTQLRNQIKNKKCTPSGFVEKVKSLFFGHTKNPQYVATQSAMAHVTRIGQQRFDVSAH